MTPSIELRNSLAVRHDNATKSEDAMVKGEDTAKSDKPVLEFLKSRLQPGGSQ